MMLKKIDQSISVIEYLLKKKRKRIDRMSKKIELSENEKIFIGEEMELIRNTETLIFELKKGINSDLGRIPPQSLDMEENVLGALILEDKYFHKIKKFLLPEHFHKDAHKDIYAALLYLDNNNYQIDIGTIIIALRKSGKLESCGGAFYLAQLHSKTTSSANIEIHARILIEFAIKRKLIQSSSNLIGVAYDDTTDCFELLTEAKKDINEIDSWIK